MNPLGYCESLKVEAFLNFESVDSQVKAIFKVKDQTEILIRLMQVQKLFSNTQKLFPSRV